MQFINKMFLHCFSQRHVSALALSHLQVDYYFLCKANHTINMSLREAMEEHLINKKIKQIMFDYILPIYFMTLCNTTGMSYVKTS